jgi:hypothetical protein
MTPHLNSCVALLVLTECVSSAAGKGRVVPHQPRFWNGQCEAGAPEDTGTDSKQPGQNNANTGGTRKGAPSLQILSRCPCPPICVALVPQLSHLNQPTPAPLPQDILRQFRSRLFDVEDKLKKDQSKKDEGTQLTKEWVEKSGQLVQELEKYRDEALRLDRLNEQVCFLLIIVISTSSPSSSSSSLFSFSSSFSASLTAKQLSNENQRLKTQAKCQEDDREFLVRQIVALKKENSRLHKDVEKAALSSLKSTLNTSPGPAAPAAASGADAAGAGESIAKYTRPCAASRCWHALLPC